MTTTKTLIMKSAAATALVAVLGIAASGCSLGSASHKGAAAPTSTAPTTSTTRPAPRSTTTVAPAAQPVSHTVVASTPPCPDGVQTAAVIAAVAHLVPAAAHDIDSVRIAPDARSWAHAHIAATDTHNAVSMVLECANGQWKMVDEGTELDGCKLPAIARNELGIACSTTATPPVSQPDTAGSHTPAGAAGYTPKTVVTSPAQSYSDAASMFVNAWENHEDAQLARYGTSTAVTQAKTSYGKNASGMKFMKCNLSGTVGSCVWTGTANLILVRVDKTTRFVTSFEMQTTF